LPACILSGGEPVVHLAKTDKPRKGGRNQQLVLAALDALMDDTMDRIVLLSGGTDGEDGPTDAAGALADAQLLRAARQKGLDPRPYLERNDSYAFFEPLGGLLKTGPTHTNVMDLRVALVGK
jgi:glycerate-2-kinase